MNPKKLALLIALFVLAGCTSIRDTATLTLYRAQRKVLVYVQSPCGGPGSSQPYLVSGWVRERDMNRLIVVCKPDCTDCRLTVQRRIERGTKP